MCAGNKQLVYNDILCSAKVRYINLCFTYLLTYFVLSI